MSSFNLNEIFTAGEQVSLPSYIERGITLFMQHGMPGHEVLDVVVTAAGYMIGNSGAPYGSVREAAEEAAKLLIETADRVFLKRMSSGGHA